MRLQVVGASRLPVFAEICRRIHLMNVLAGSIDEYWTHHVDDLKPTAGYPVDAKRFKQQIEPTQKRLGIDDRVLWRCR